MKCASFLLIDYITSSLDPEPVVCSRHLIELNASTRSILNTCFLHVTPQYLEEESLTKVLRHHGALKVHEQHLMGTPHRT